MKFAVAFAAFVAVAVASPVLMPTDSGVAELEAIIAAIQSPSTDPATAALLEQQLAEILAEIHPVTVAEPSPVAVGPTIIDFPLPDGGALTPGLTPVSDGGALTSGLTPVETGLTPVAPTPAVVSETVQTGSPLVQIILNINKAGSEAPQPAPVVPAPVDTPVAVDPVIVVDEAVNVETPVAVAPVIVIDEAVTPVAVAPVVVVEQPVEPIQVGTPILPIPVVTAPIILN